MENVGIFYGHLEYLVYFMAACGYLVYISRFGIFYKEQSGNPGWN
jgi:hypothetical protein